MKLVAAAVTATVARQACFAPAAQAFEHTELATPTRPRPHSRPWIADHLGLAADALEVATTQVGRVAPNVIGNFLEQSSRELSALLPDAKHIFSRESGVTEQLAKVNTAIQELARDYFLQDRMPPTSPPCGWLLARYTYTVRRAQDLLEGIGA